MMILRTAILAESLCSVSVAWSTGLKNHGVVKVQFPEPQAGHDLIAEFVAIRYLLFRAQVFNRLPITGEGLAFELSSIKPHAIVTGARKTKNIVPYARFLWSDMVGAQFKINMAPDELPRIVDASTAVEIEFDPYNDAGLIKFDTPSFGKIQVSPHAVERYTERSSDFMKAPRHSLMRVLLKPGFKKVAMPDSIIQHKQMRYGPNDPVETWTYHGSSNFFLFVVKGSYRVLVTIYNPQLSLVKARQAEMRRATLRKQWMAEREASVLPKPKRQVRVVMSTKK